MNREGGDTCEEGEEESADEIEEEEGGCRGKEREQRRWIVVPAASREFPLLRLHPH